MLLLSSLLSLFSHALTAGGQICEGRTELTKIIVMSSSRQSHSMSVMHRYQTVLLHRSLYWQTLGNMQASHTTGRRCLMDSDRSSVLCGGACMPEDLSIATRSS